MVGRNLKGKELEEYKNSLELTDKQKDIIVGTLLGDATMTVQFSKAIKFEQCEARAQYVDHLHEVFEPFTGSPPKWRWIDKEKTRRARYFRTYRHNTFLYYWQSFYTISNNKAVKIVPTNISKLLTPRALAYWFMDDGTLCSDKKSFHLNTQGFALHECERLCTVLREKYGLTVSLHVDKNKWRIYIFRNSAQAFKDLVQSYVIACFSYKLDIQV